MKAILIDEPSPSDGGALLQGQLDALAQHGVRGMLRVGRPGGHTPKGVTSLIRAQHQGPDDLHSFFAAGPHLVGPIILIQGRVPVTPAMLAPLIAHPSPAAVAVDRGWRKANIDPPPGAILTEEEHGFIIRLSAGLMPEAAQGAFMGVMRFDAPLMGRLWAQYLNARASGGLPGHGEADLSGVGLTDLLNVAIADEERFLAVPFDSRT